MSTNGLKMKTEAEKAVQQLLQSPQLPLVVRRFESILEAEQEKRKRFYDEISEHQKAEFINGEVIVQTPVKLRHSRASENLFRLLSIYVQRHNLGYTGHEKILVSLSRNDYEPDICFFRQAVAQTFTPDQIKFPAPDLVVEIVSPSSEAIDRGIKFEDYAAHGVGEYWIVDPSDEFIEQYLLKKDIYELLVKAKSGTIQSAMVKGFEIPVRAIFDAEENLAAVQAILE